MPIPKNYSELVETLLLLSENHKVSWKQSWTAQRFDLRTSDSEVFQVWGDIDEDTDRRFVGFSLMDAKGEASLDHFFVREGEDGFSMMDQLLGAARRNALEVDLRLDSVMKRLRHQM